MKRWHEIGTAHKFLRLAYYGPYVALCTVWDILRALFLPISWRGKKNVILFHLKVFLPRLEFRVGAFLTTDEWLEELKKAVNNG